MRLKALMLSIGAISKAIATIFRRFERLIRFGLVGITVSILYSALTIVLIGTHWASSAVMASAMAFLATLPISFFAHSRVTYSDVERKEAHWKRFGLIALSSFIIATGAMQIAENLHWPYWTGLLAGWVLIPVTNYWINTVWVFRSKKMLSLDRAGES
jgi:putative flippase GtrA